TSSGNNGRSERGHVWTAPGWQELFSRLQHWSVQPCVRPFCAVHIPAGHNALRGSGPGQQLAYKNAMTHVGRLIAGSTGSALRAVRPANIAPVTRRDFVHRTSAKGSLYRPPAAITADVLLDGVLVGRIVLSPSAPNDHQCHRDRTPTRGYEPPSPAR